MIAFEFRFKTFLRENFGCDFYRGGFKGLDLGFSGWRYRVKNGGLGQGPDLRIWGGRVLV